MRMMSVGLKLIVKKERGEEMKIKDQIAEYEYHMNGFKQLNGRHVKVVNLRVRKDKYIADVTLIDDFDGYRESFKDCEYDKTLFNKGGKV